MEVLLVSFNDSLSPLIECNRKLLFQDIPDSLLGHPSIVVIVSQGKDFASSKWIFFVGDNHSEIPSICGPALQKELVNIGQL